MTNMETTTANTTELVSEYLKVKDKFDSLAQRLGELEDTLKTHLNNAGVDTVEIGNRTVRLVRNQRRSFNVDALKGLISPALFRKVTEPSVKTKLWDSALALGQIGDEVVNEVVTITEYDQLRVK